MKIYLFSDIHFFHDNIMKYTSRYSNSIDEYQNDFIEYASKILNQNDILIFLGDLACGPRKNLQHIKYLLDKLKCKKIFIRGNHDTWLDDSTILKLGFSYVSDLLIYKNTLFCHYPLDKRSVIPKQAPSYFKKLDLTGIKEIYHGHIHNNFSPDTNDNIKRINCCVDRVPDKLNPLIEFKLY